MEEFNVFCLSSQGSWGRGSRPSTVASLKIVDCKAIARVDRATVASNRITRTDSCPGSSTASLWLDTVSGLGIELLSVGSSPRPMRG